MESQIPAKVFNSLLLQVFSLQVFSQICASGHSSRFYKKDQAQTGLECRTLKLYYLMLLQMLRWFPHFGDPFAIFLDSLPIRINSGGYGPVLSIRWLIYFFRVTWLQLMHCPLCSMTSIKTSGSPDGLKTMATHVERPGSVFCARQTISSYLCKDLILGSKAKLATQPCPFSIFFIIYLQIEGPPAIPGVLQILGVSQ